MGKFKVFVPSIVNVCGHPPECCLHQKGTWKLGNNCAFQHTERSTLLSFRAKGDLLQGVSPIPVKSILKKIGNDMCQKFPTVSYRKKMCERKRKERFDFGNYATRRTKQSKSERSFVRATPKLCFFVIQTWTLLAENHGTCRTLTSRSHCEHEDREHVVDSGASLHMMSKNEPFATRLLVPMKAVALSLDWILLAWDVGSKIVP